MEEVAMRVWFRGRSPFAFLFVRSRSEQYLSEYALREHARGRSLEDVLEDPYIRNRSTPEERARLLERPEVVAALGEQTVADLRLALAGVHTNRRGAARPVADASGSDRTARVLSPDARQPVSAHREV
jgi:hypothetical protein